ncbi:MAG: hypothetical protein P8184_16265 [Calditrichia bacterium]
MRFAINLMIIIVLALTSLAAARESQALLKIENLLVTIRISRGNILFPDEYFNYKQQYDNLKAAAVGDSLSESQMGDAEALLSKLRDLYSDAEKVLPYFTSVLETREQAIGSSAEDFAPDYYQKAQDELEQLALRFRKSVPEKSEQQIAQLLNLYHQAQFEAIRNKLLGEVRILIQESKDMDAEKYAPRTYALVNDLFTDVENILKKNNYNNPDLQEKSSRLLAESQHLLYLVQVAQRINRNEADFEEWVLQLETSVNELAAQLNYQPQYSEGITPVLENVKRSVEEVQAENQRLKGQNAQLADSMAQMRQEINRIKNQLGEQQRVSQKIESLKRNLAGNGINIFQEGNDLILHLGGVRFQPGRIQVNDGYQAVLEKMGQAIQTFAGQPVVVRLSQASGGNLEYSKSLAEVRAKGVALIVQSAGYIQDRNIRSEVVLLKDEPDNRDVVIDLVIGLN